MILMESGHANEYPLNHARILYGNVSSQTISATGATANFPAALALTDSTYERWKPATTGDSITLEFPAQNVNAIAIAAHNRLDFTLQVKTVNSGFETVKLFRPDSQESLSADMVAQEYGLLDYSPDNQAILMLIKERQLSAIKITVSYTAEAPTIGIFRAGKVLEMMRPFYQGHSPAMLSSNARVQPNVSESGEWLGASLIREGRSLNLAWQNLTADWVRSKWAPFAQYIKTKPYFIAWNPLQFPSDCFYAVSSSVPKPTNSGPRNYQAITLQAQAYSDGSDPVVESLGSKTFSELFDFERNSNATYYDVSGTLQTVGANIPRFTYDPVTLDAQGLLIEEARTNYANETESPNNSNLFSMSEIRNYEVSPDAKLRAFKIVPKPINSNHYIDKFSSGNMPVSAFTVTFFAKADGESNWASYGVDSAGATGTCVYDIDALTVSDPSKGSITDVGAGWYKITYTSTWNTGVSPRFRLFLRNASFTGDGVSGLLLYGFNFELGSFGTSYMPSAETFTSRASTATYIDSNGAWQVAGVNSERSAAYGYDTNGDLKLIGQLFEEQRTNYLQYNRRLNLSPWGAIRAVVLPNQAEAPGGTYGAAKLQEDTTASSTHSVVYDYTVGLGTFTTSIYIKAAERTFASVGMTDGVTATVFINVNLNSGVYTLTTGGSWTSLTGSVTLAGNGWWRVSITAIRGAGTYTGVRIFTSTSLGSITHTGDGQSGVYVWGAQLEIGAYPTSLTPDATTFTSRSTKATYTNSSGVIVEAAIDEERNANYVYDSGNNLVLTPTVLEPSRTNSFLHSRWFGATNWAKVRATVIPESQLAPEGQFTGDKLILNGTAATNHYIQQSVNFATGSSYTVSIFAKAAELDQIIIQLPAAAFGTDKFRAFDLTAGTVVATGTAPKNFGVENYGNGWYRCWMADVATATVSAGVTFYLSAGASTIINGDNVSGVYIWGAQIEAGAPATTLTPDNTTFTSRSTTATYLDSNGVIQTAAINTARDPAYAYDENGDLQEIGLLLENASTNLLLYSEAFDNVAWTKSRASISADATNAPDSNATADKLIEDSTAANTHVITQSISWTTGTTYTFSCYFKADTRTEVELLFSGTAFGTTKGRSFDLSNGASFEGDSPSTIRYGIEAAGNGWYRCYITDTTTANATASAAIFLSKDGTRTYDGDGASGLFIWGVQVEAQQYATSYIPTTSAAVTRAADVASSPAFARSADLSSSPAVTRSADVYTSTALARAADVATRTPGVEFNSRAFTVYVEANYNDNDIEIFFDSNSGATTDDKDRINLYRSSATNNIIGNIKDKFGTSVSRSISSADGAGAAKIALSFDADTGAFILAANGTSSSTTTAIEKIEPSRFVLGARFDLGLYELNDNIKDIKIYGRALTATELEALTA